MDFSIFTTPEAWISLVTLLFLEIVLGVDNLVFITITCNRLPSEKEHIGRIAGLAGAFVSRCIFLSFASWLVSMSADLFTLPFGRHIGISVRDIILIVGGAYLIYKGITELRDVLNLTEEKTNSAQVGGSDKKPHEIGLAQAVVTIMVMDVVFSIDSVITAVGLANQLIIMVLAVMIAIILMMIFIDAIGDFINKNVEMKVLALTFIVAIGVLLVLDGLDITTGIELLEMHAEKVMVYFAMLFSFVITLLQMKRKNNFEAWASKHQSPKSGPHADDSSANILEEDSSDVSGSNADGLNTSDTNATSLGATNPVANDKKS